MRAISNREKNLALAVILVAGFSFWSILRRNLVVRRTFLEEDLRIASERVRHAKDLLEATSPPPTKMVENIPAIAPSDNTKLTLILLQDLTRPKESENVRILNVSRSSETTFRMEVQGGFTEMMRYFSYLERKESYFYVTSAELTRVISEVAPGKLVVGQGLRENSEALHHEVKGVIQILTRGSS